jgi:hypothetical protein
LWLCWEVDGWSIRNVDTFCLAVIVGRRVMENELVVVEAVHAAALLLMIIGERWS